METLEELERNVRRRMRWMMIAGIGVVIVLLGVVAVVGYLVVSHKDTHREHTSEQQKKNPHDTNGTSEGPVSTQDLAHVTWDGSTYPPTPVSEEHGPFQRVNGRAWGFAHTPVGASMAAIHISVRASHLAGPSIFEPTFEHQVIPNEASANSLKDAREDYEKDAPVRGVDERGQIAPDYPVTFIGIRAVSYDDASAKIALLVGGLDHAETGQYLGMILDLRWIDGDWNLFLAEKEVEPLRATRKDLDLVALLPERS